jgi:hypothetical protein
MRGNLKIGEILCQLRGKAFTVFFIQLIYFFPHFLVFHSIFGNSLTFLCGKSRKMGVAWLPSGAATSRLHFSLVSRATAIFWKFHQLRNCVFSRLRALHQFFGNSLTFLTAFASVLPKCLYCFSGKLKKYRFQNFAMFGKFWKKRHCIQCPIESDEGVIGNFGNAFFRFAKVACVLVLVLWFFDFAVVETVSAQDPNYTRLEIPKPETLPGPVGLSQSKNYMRDVLLVAITRSLISLAGGIAFVFFIYNSIRLMLAMGEDIEPAKKNLIWSMVGFLIAIFSYAIVYLIGLIQLEPIVIQ